MLDPAQPVDAGCVWALGEAVCEDLRAMRLSVEAPPTVEDVLEGIAQSEAWWAVQAWACRPGRTGGTQRAATHAAG